MNCPRQLRGFRFFDLADAADLLTSAITATDIHLQQMDIHYAKLVPTDQLLLDHYNAILLASPEAFAPP